MAKNPFKGFTPLSSNGNIYLYTPEKTAQNGSATTKRTGNSPSPDLVVLSTWMGALPKHILKYTAAYQSSYPSSSILVITNDVPDIAFRPGWLQQKRLQPASKFLHDFRADRKDARILCHILSNGGCWQVVQLGQIYREKYGTGLPIDALALDSSPGTGRDFTEGLNAIILAFPAPLRLLSTPLVYILMAYFWARIHLFGMRNVIDDLRAGLLDPKLIATNVPRVYIYSKEDKLIGYKQVEVHADEAKQKGYPTECVRMDGSQHVQHMMKDSERYWGAVTGVLKETEAKKT